MNRISIFVFRMDHPPPQLKTSQLSIAWKQKNEKDFSPNLYFIFLPSLPFDLSLLRKLVQTIYFDAPDRSSGKRRQQIHIKYDGLGLSPLDELM